MSCPSHPRLNVTRVFSTAIILVALLGLALTIPRTHAAGTHGRGPIGARVPPRRAHAAHITGAGPAVAPQGAPSNNNFAAAQMLSGVSGTVSGSNVGATKEAGEPVHAGNAGGASVWYKWTAPSSGGINIDTFSSSFNTLLAVYNGSSVGALTPVAGNDNDRGETGDIRNSSRVFFSALAGTTYFIAVDGISAATGNVVLNWSLLPPPENNNYANAQSISGTADSVNGFNAGATKETGEPNHAGHAGGASVWYRWVAPASGSVSFSTAGSYAFNTSFNLAFDTLLAAYTGSSVNSLTAVASNDNEGPVTSRITFGAVAGTTYYLAVDGKDGATGKISLSWGYGGVPNDPFAQAQGVFDGAGSVNGSNVNATTEPGEPVAGGFSVWYNWTAPNTGAYFFSADPFPHPIPTNGQVSSTTSVYTGTSVDALSLVGRNTGLCMGFQFQSCNSSRVSFNAVAGTNYKIAVTGGPGPVILRWGLSTGAGAAAPPNDSFANATVINGFNSSVNGTTVGATLQDPGEPNHAMQQGASGGASVWYRWTAPSSVQVFFTASAPCFNNQSSLPSASMGVYTGASTNALTEVGKSIGSCNPFNPSSSRPAILTFDAVQGTTYQISIDRDFSTSFPLNFILSWAATTPPANNHFANAQVISGPSGGVYGYTTSATLEPGEPNHAGQSFSNSIWYSWTAANSGFVIFNTDGSSSNPVLAVYTGASVGALTPIASHAGSPSHVKFNAAAGTTYRVALAGGSGTRLNWGSPASIAGRVVDIRAVGIANIQIALGGDASRTTVTDAQGNYTFPNLIQGGNYTVTPAISSFTFDQPSRTYNPLSGDVTNANFTALTPVYTIEGLLKTAGGCHIVDAPVTISGSINCVLNDCTTTTNSSGRYTFYPLTTNGNFTVTPGTATDVFAPPFLNFFVLNYSRTNANFTGTYTITGQVTGNGGPLAGVTMTLSGAQTGSTTTDGSGNFTFANLSACGNYTVTPTLNGHTFTPTAHTFENLRAYRATQNFSDNTAAPLRIDTVSPRAGRTSGGQQLTLTGSFTGLASVKIGGVAAAFTGGAAGTLTVTTPAHAAGAVIIELVPVSGDTLVKPDAFAYLSTAFTDDPLVAGVTAARAQHVLELRQAVEALRAVAGLAPAQWTDPVLPSSSTIRAEHITQLRTYLEEAATQLGYPAAVYTDPNLGPGVDIKRVHVEQLRERIRAIAG